MNNKILSIQSKLVYGYVGSNVAEFAIQLHGLDVIAFPTVYLSAHTGHQPSYGMKVDRKLFSDLVTGIENIGVLDSVAHIVTGYVGVKDMLDSVCSFISKVKLQDTNRLYLCDPVIGDDEGIYVPEDVAETVVSKLLPLCDIMTPNHFEFEYIIGGKARTEEDILKAVSSHPVLKNKTVVITSCRLEEMPADKIQTLVVKGNQCKRIETDNVAIQTTGTGDLFTAIVSAQLALGKDIIAAVTVAATVVQDVLQKTVAYSNVEMNAKSILESILKHCMV